MKWINRGQEITTTTNNYKSQSIPPHFTPGLPSSSFYTHRQLILCVKIHKKILI